MAYTSGQISEILLKADRTMYKIGTIAYNDMFSENSETLDYERDIIYIYKQSVEYADSLFLGTAKLDATVEKLAAKIAVYDFGLLNPVYSNVASNISNIIALSAALNDLTDVTISNLLNNQILRYDAGSGQWVNVGPGSAVRNSQSFIATAGQTIFTTSYPFDAGLFDVYLNGVRLNTTSFTTMGEYQITLVDAASAGDIIDVVIYDPSTSISNPINSLADLDDVLLGPLSNKHALYYNGTSGKWENGFVFVPYTGAVQNVDLGEFGISSGYFQADLSPTQAGGVGRLIWNNTDGTLNLGLLGGNVTAKLAQQEFVRVVNGTGGNVLRSNYQAVKITGAQGQRLQVSLSRADNDNNSKDTIGLIAENINNNNEGFVIVSGMIEDINTTGSLQGETWADGDTLYLSGTTFGRVTNIKPAAPIHTVILGFVVHAHQNQGKIFVKVDNGYEIDELHNVQINTGTLANGQVLKYNATTQLWENNSDSGITGSGASGQVAYFTGATTQTGSNNLFWDNTNGRLGIGTNAPSRKLSVDGGAASTYIQVVGGSRNLLLGQDSTGGAIISEGAFPMYFATNSLERMRITSDGNVLIGSISDTTERLQVTGTMKVTGASTFATSTFNGLMTVNGAAALSTANFTHTSTNGGIDVRNTGTLASGRDAQIRLVNGTTFFGANDRTYQLVNIGRSASAADFYVQYFDGTNYFDRFRVFSTGNFGINTGANDSGQRLQVIGDTLMRGSGNTSATTALTVQNSSSTDIFRVRNDGVSIFGTDALQFTVSGTQITNNSGLDIRTDRCQLRSNAGLVYFSNQGDSGSSGVVIMAGRNGSFTQFAPILFGSGLSQSLSREIMRIDNLNQSVLIGTTTDQISKLVVGGSQTAASAIARGALVNTTLVAAANNDVLVGLDVNPTFTNGAFTGVINASIRWSNNSGWGLYGAGTANNYLNGSLAIGNTTVSTFGNGGITLGSTTNGKSLVLTSSIAGENGLIQFIDSSASNAFQIAASAANISLFGYGSRPMIFWTNGSERGRIFANGNFGINTGATDSGQRLQVTGTTLLNGNVTFSSTTGMFWDATNNRLGIGIATPSVSLDVRTSAVGELAYFANTAANSGFIIGTQTNVGYISSISSLSALGFGINGTTTAIRIFTNSNVSINNNVDLGVRFSVVGDTRLIGSGNTSATTALTVQNSDSTSLFSVRNDGLIRVGNSGGAQFSAPQIYTSFSNETLNTGGATLVFNHRDSTVGTTNGGFFYTGTVYSPTSGANVFLNIARNFEPTSGTASFSLLQIRPSINQTGGANGITRGLYVNPNLALGSGPADWRSIEWSNSTGWGLYGAGTAANYLAGSLGIGTTTMTYSFNVTNTGATYVAGFRGGSSSYIVVGDTSLGGESGINFRNSSGQGFVGIGGTILGITATSGANTITFSTGGNERARIDVSGNLLVGSATPLSTEKFGVYATNAGGVVMGRIQNLGTTTGTISQLTLTTNTSSAGTAVSSSIASLATDASGNTAMTFGNATAGTGSEKMRLAPTGNLLINSTTDSGERLQVTGTMRVSGASTFNSDMSYSRNTNAINSLNVINTTDGTDAQSRLYLQGGSGAIILGQRSNLTTSYKILSANDGYLFKATVGDIAILNDATSGSIKMAAGGSSTAHLTIASTGAATFSSSVTVGGNLTVDTNTLFVDATNNRVGIGTITPSKILEINQSIGVNDGIRMTNTSGGYFQITNSSGTAYQPIFESQGSGNVSSMIFKGLQTTTGSPTATVMRFVARASDDSSAVSGVNAMTFENGTTSVLTIASNNAATFSSSVTGTQFRLSALNTAPASATDTGTLGEIRIDADFIYICTAANTWKRVAIATW